MRNRLTVTALFLTLLSIGATAQDARTILASVVEGDGRGQPERHHLLGIARRT